MITIVLGDTTEYLCHHAQQLDKSAQLLTRDNFTRLVNGTYYTSLGDINEYRLLMDVLECSDVIIYAPPQTWSDQDSRGFSYMKHWTEYCLFYFNDKKTIIGYTVDDPPNMSQILHLESNRKTAERQLWVVGGSDSRGVGVSSNERYGQIIADRIDIPVSFLTKSLSSIEWAADQILRSDIRTGDIVIWGLVPASRFPFFDGNEVVHMCYSHLMSSLTSVKDVDTGQFIEQLLNLNTLLYRPITSIARVQNFCNKLGINLVIAGIVNQSEYSAFLKSFKNYIHLGDRFGVNHDDMLLDLGSDKQHPGVKMHQWYADQIFNKMSLLGFDLVAKT